MVSLEQNNEHLTLSWLSDFRYSKYRGLDGVNIKAQLIFNDGSKFSKKYLSIYSLFDKIVGNTYDDNNEDLKLIKDNPSLNRAIYKFTIGQEDLLVTADFIYKHLGFLKSDDYKNHVDKEFLKKLPDEFGYSCAHKIENRIPNSNIDYFLIPSFEILRYFFFHSSSFSRTLLSYFTSDSEKTNRSMSELFLHPTGSPFIINQGVERIANLAVKEGLSNRELACLARIAFIRPAFDCIESIKTDLSNHRFKNPTKEFDYKKLETVIPQDKPFEIAACGEQFKWNNKTYGLIYQIYDTKETFPYDTVQYTPFIDHRGTKEQGGINTNSSTNQRQSTPSPSAKLTDKELGDSDQKAQINMEVKTGYLFADNPAVKLQKLTKDEQENYYGASSVENIEKELLSLQEAIGGKAGRAEVKVAQGTDFDQENPRRTVFLDAIKLISKDFIIRYFNLLAYPARFESTTRIIYRKKTLDVNILLCQIEKTVEEKSFYIYILVMAE